MRLYLRTTNRARDMWDKCPSCSTSNPPISWSIHICISDYLRAYHIRTLLCVGVTCLAPQYVKIRSPDSNTIFAWQLVEETSPHAPFTEVIDFFHKMEYHSLVLRRIFVSLIRPINMELGMGSGSTLSRWWFGGTVQVVVRELLQQSVRDLTLLTSIVRWIFLSLRLKFSMSNDRSDCAEQPTLEQCIDFFCIQWQPHDRLRDPTGPSRETHKKTGNLRPPTASFPYAHD